MSVRAAMILLAVSGALVALESEILVGALEPTVQSAGLSRLWVGLILVPIVANVLLFVPWGFLMFLALYSVERPTVQTYVLTILLGFTFSCAIEAWQYFLPSRVADINDVIWNTVGTSLGAVAGHLRRRVRFEFI